MTNNTLQTVNHADALNDAVAQQAQACFSSAVQRYELTGDLAALFSHLVDAKCPVAHGVGFCITAVGVSRMTADLERFEPELLNYNLPNIVQFEHPDAHLVALGIQTLVGVPILGFKKALAEAIGVLYSKSLSLSNGPEAPTLEFNQTLEKLLNV